MPFILDNTFLIYVLPAIIVSIIAQGKIKRAYIKYQNVHNHRGYTGAQVARMILDRFGLQNVAINQIPGELTDHYDPRSNTVNLSSLSYNGKSVTSLGIAAHEVGHAIQHSVGYVPIKLRNAVLPVANIATTVAFPLAIIGILFSFPMLANFGIVLFSAVVLFQLITLPVEYNASHRAITLLQEENILDEEEIYPVKKVLSAAAMTYVAAAMVAMGNLLRLISLSRRNN